MTLQVATQFLVPQLRYADDDDDPYDRETQLAAIVQHLEAMDGTVGHGRPYQRLGVRAVSSSVAMSWAMGNV